MKHPAVSQVPDVLLHIPHASAVIPPEHRRRFVLGDADLNREILKVTDWFTDDLFALDGAERLVFGVSRLLVDPERFIDDAQEIMAERGLGAVYTRTHDGRRLKRATGRAKLLAAFYTPHHQALNAWASAALETHGRCLIIDCHSFPSKPLSCDLDQTPARPDFCIGSVEPHSPSRLVSAATDAIEALKRRASGTNYTVLENRPYSGSIVPADYYGRDPRVCAVMIEVNRALYMDEESGERLAGYDEFRTDLKRVLDAVADAWADKELAREIWETVDLELGIEPIKRMFERAAIRNVVEGLRGMKNQASYALPEKLLFTTALLEANPAMQGLVEFLRDEDRVPMYTSNWVVTMLRQKLKEYEKTSFSGSTRMGAGEYAVNVVTYSVPGCGVFCLEFIGDDEIELHGIELGNLSKERVEAWISSAGPDEESEWSEEDDDEEE